MTCVMHAMHDQHVWWDWH